VALTSKRRVTAMQTICLVGYELDGPVSRLLRDCGFFVLTAATADVALAMLSAVRADAFIINVGEPSVAGERLIEQLGTAAPWRQLPIVVTGANAAQHARWAQRATVGEVIPEGDGRADAVLLAVRELLHRGGGTAPCDDVPGRHAWGDDDLPVLPSNLHGWIPPHTPSDGG
jgi:DNA-binding NarL/FixJ family response regulator